jgi:hypothetical protein
MLRATFLDECEVVGNVELARQKSRQSLLSGFSTAHLFDSIEMAAIFLFEL